MCNPSSSSDYCDNNNAFVTKPLYATLVGGELERSRVSPKPETKYMYKPVLPFQPKYRLSHPENYLFLLSKKLFTGSEYPKNKLFNFEKNFTGCDDMIPFLTYPSMVLTTVRHFATYSCYCASFQNTYDCKGSERIAVEVRL